MSKSDYVAFPYSNLKILVHLPLIDASNKLKLYQHISTPFRINKDGYQLMIDGDDLEFIAIGSMDTLYAIMKNLDDCTSILDIKICQKMTTTLKKVGTSEPDCLLNLFIRNYEKAKVSCNYRSRKPTEFAIRLNHEHIYLYSPNSTLLQEKFLSENCQLSSQYSVEIKGANILTIEPGCTLTTKVYVFSRARQLIGEELSPIYVNAMDEVMTQLLQENSIDEDGDFMGERQDEVNRNEIQHFIERSKLIDTKLT